LKLFIAGGHFDFSSGQWAKGQQIWHNGSTYEGTYRYGKFHGKGRMIHQNGDYYEGDFEHGEAVGQGCFAK